MPWKPLSSAHRAVSSTSVGVCDMLGQTENFMAATVTCSLVADASRPDRDQSLDAVREGSMREPARDPSRDLWERHAQWWIDGFTDGADPEYEEQILPIAAAELGDARTILDIGCGDGQISRMMAAVGATVVGVDPTWNQIRVAHGRGGGVG